MTPSIPKVKRKLKEGIEQMTKELPILQGWTSHKSPKRCPVCKFDRTYAGPVCPPCAGIGYVMLANGRTKRILKGK